MMAGELTPETIEQVSAYSDIERPDMDDIRGMLSDEDKDCTIQKYPSGNWCIIKSFTANDGTEWETHTDVHVVRKHGEWILQFV